MESSVTDTNPNKGQEQHTGAHTEKSQTVTNDVHGTTTTTTTKTTTIKETSGTATIEPSSGEYAAFASFETEFPETAFAGIKADDVQIEVSYQHEGKEYIMEINLAQFGPKGEILINGKEGEHVFTMRGRFTEAGEVHMVKYYESHKVKYVGTLENNHITGKWYLPDCSDTFKISFKGQLWGFVEDVFTLTDDTSITSIGRLAGKWGLLHGTKTGDQLELTMYFPGGTQTTLTGTETTENLTLKYKKPDGTEEDLFMTKL